MIDHGHYGNSTPCPQLWQHQTNKNKIILRYGFLLLCLPNVGQIPGIL